MMTNSAMPDFSRNTDIRSNEHPRKGVVQRENAEATAAGVRKEHQEFSRIYRQVAHENGRARDAGTRQGGRIGKEQEFRQCVERSGEPDRLQRDTNESRPSDGEYECRPFSDETASSMTVAAQDASRIIREALESISRVLDLDIVADIKDFDIGGSARGLADHFAEIIHLLQSVGEMLAFAVEQNQPVQIHGEEFSPARIVELERMVRVTTFQIELACTMVGVSGDVGETVARLAQTDSRGLGLAVAVDLSARHMPSMHLRQIMEGMVRTREEEFRVLTDKINSVLQRLSTAPQEMEMLPVKVIHPAELTPQGTMIMRSLHKLDAVMMTQTQNVEAAQKLEKLDMPRAWDLVMSRDVAELAMQSDRDLMPVMELMGRKGGWDALAAVVGSRTADTLMKHVEQSVMNQLVEKFSSVVRTGISEVRLTLRPESLGEVRMKVTIHGDLVSARIHVENQQVRQIVENNLQALKSALEEHNLQAGSFEVNVNTRSPGDGQPMWTAREGGTDEEESGAIETVTGEGGAALGMETGKRYGTNTVEYFG